MSRQQRLTLFIFIGLSVVASFAFYFLKTDEDSILEFVSVWGSFASLSAFIFIFFQIQSQQELTREIDAKVKETKNLLTKILSISDISKGVKIAEQAQTFLRIENYESALLRLKDLKEILIFIIHYNETQNIIDLDPNDDHLLNMSIDLSNINDMIMKKKTSINVSKIINNLENLSSFIADFQLKVQDYDTGKY